MTRNQLRRLSLLSAFVLMATIPQYILPMVEAETVTVTKGRGKGIEIR